MGTEASDHPSTGFQTSNAAPTLPCLAPTLPLWIWFSLMWECAMHFSPFCPNPCMKKIWKDYPCFHMAFLCLIQALWNISSIWSERRKKMYSNDALHFHNLLYWSLPRCLWVRLRDLQLHILCSAKKRYPAISALQAHPLGSCMCVCAEHHHFLPSVWLESSVIMQSKNVSSCNTNLWKMKSLHLPLSGKKITTPWCLILISHLFSTNGISLTSKEMWYTREGDPCMASCIQTDLRQSHTHSKGPTEK